VSGGRVERSIVSPSVRVNSFASVTDSILFEGVEVGRHAKIRNAIIDKNVKIPPGFEIGIDLEKDAQRGFTVSPKGIVTVAKTEDLSIFVNGPSATPFRSDLPSRPSLPHMDSMELRHRVPMDLRSREEER
jgi:glucose-1-phosphate adenylyltransferase